MAESLKIRIEGLAELQAKARKVEDKLARRSYSRAVRAGAKPIKERAISRAPGRTGTLKKSITARANNKPAQMLFGMKLTVAGGKFSSGKTAQRKGRGKVYRPDESVRYYRFQELGTKYHPAKAFLEPALESGAAAFLSTLKRELASELEKSVL